MGNQDRSTFNDHLRERTIQSDKIKLKIKNGGAKNVKSEM